MKFKKMFEKLKKGLPLISLLFLGTLLRFYRLGDLIFHLDEPRHTLLIAAQPLAYNLVHDYGSIPYQVLVHFLLPYGKSEFVSRLPAALFGILIIAATYYVGKLLCDKKTGFLAALFVSFSHYLLSYSQYARAYTAFAFFSLLSLFFFYTAIKKNDTKYWILYLLFSVINIYMHLITVLTIVAFAAYVGILWIEKFISVNKKRTWVIDKQRILRFVLYTLVILGINFLLRMPVGEMDGDTSTINWIAETITRILGEPTIGFFPLINQILAYQMFHFPSFSYFVALAFIILGIIGCIIRMKREDVFLLTSIFVPLVCFYLLKPRPLFFLAADRYFIYLLPIIFILLVKGMSLLSSFCVSLGSYAGVIKRGKDFHRNLTLAFLVACFFLLECFALKDYVIHSWQLSSLKAGRTIQTVLKDEAVESDVIFFDDFPNSTSVLFLTPFDLENGEKRVMISKANIQNLDSISHQSRGLWLVLNRSLLSHELPPGTRFALEDTDSANVGGTSIIHWEPGNTRLSNKMIQMIEFLLPLHPDREGEYRLLLANFHLLNQNLKEAVEELDILEEKNISHPGKKLQDSFSIVFNSLQRNVERQLWVLGNNLISEENLSDGFAAMERCVQISDEFHVSISQVYFSLGNRLYGEGSVNQAFILLKRAVELNPGNYFYHLVLAEAYWSKNMKEEALHEYKIGLNAASLSDEFIMQLISKPELFSVWKDGDAWHFLWRSDEPCEYSGNFYFGKKIDRMQKHHFIKRDIVNQNKDYAVEFSFSTLERKIKTLDIDAGRNSKLTCYIKVNGQMKTDGIIFINSGENPKEIPFSLSADGIQ